MSRCNLQHVNTPQQNSVAEVVIVTVMNCVRVMMHHVNLPLEIWYHVLHKACKTLTLLDGLVVLTHHRTMATCFEQI